MLQDLKILNGNLELAFNEYTYEYTVKVEEDIDALEMHFKLAPGCNVSVLNNNLVEIDTIVTIRVYNDQEEEFYTLDVHKNISEEMTGILDYKESLEVEVKRPSIFKVQMLGISMFFILVLIFCLLFRKNNKKKHHLV